MKNRRRVLLSDDGTENFWPSFTDLISTIAMILFVLVLLAYIQNLISGRNLDAMKAELALSARRLASSQQEVGRSEDKLRALEAELRKTSAEIEAGQAQLKVSEDKLAEQQGIITQSNQELEQVRSKLQGIAVLRVDVLNKVKRSIETELGRTSAGGAPLVTVAENGNIVINESLVFEYNSFAIKEAGKPFLDSLAKALGSLLADPGARENIDTILIQGHTDERGTAEFNRDLSAKRANAVLDYLFAANPVLERAYGAYFASSAYSEFRPVNPAKTEQAYEQNRRIEISVVLKDSNVRRVIDEYMQSQNAAPRGDAGP